MGLIERWDEEGSSGGGGGGGSLTVTEIDGSPVCAPVSKIVFNGTSEVVSCSPGVAYINAAAPPPPLGGDFVLSGTTLYLGRESDGNINYEGAAGDAHDYITYDGTLILTEPSFGYASQGVLTLSLNGSVVAQIDLGSNFVEANRSSGQNMNDYDTGIGPYSLVDGRCDFIGSLAGMGYMIITHVDPTSGIDTDQYQEGRVEVHIQNSSFWRQGYNYIELSHTGCSACPRYENTFKIFYDTDPYGTNDPQATSQDLSEGVVSPKYVSGVEYYGDGSTFTLNFIVDYAFNNVYHVSNAPAVINDGPSDWGISDTEIPYTDPSVSGVSAPPQIGETMTVSNYQITVPQNQDENDAVISVTPRDPYGNYTTVTTPSHNFMINSWGIVSDATHEYFRDEHYRFRDTTNFNTVPSQATGDWDSAVSLTSSTSGYTNALQVYDPDNSTPNRLIHPHVNYSSRNPAGNPDYSGLASGTNYRYYRVFQGTTDNSNGILSVPGLSDADLNSGNIKIEIKVPSKTMWLDVWQDYVPATFPTNAAYPGGIDGTGCRINSGIHSPDIDGTVEFTLGTYASDASVGRYLFVRVTYANSSAPQLTGEGSGFSIINW